MPEGGAALPNIPWPSQPPPVPPQLSAFTSLNSPGPFHGDSPSCASALIALSCVSHHLLLSDLASDNVPPVKSPRTDLYVHPRSCPDAVVRSQDDAPYRIGVKGLTVIAGVRRQEIPSPCSLWSPGLAAIGCCDHQGHKSPRSSPGEGTLLDWSGLEMACRFSAAQCDLSKRAISAYRDCKKWAEPALRANGLTHPRRPHILCGTAPLQVRSHPERRGCTPSFHFSVSTESQGPPVGRRRGGREACRLAAWRGFARRSGIQG